MFREEVESMVENGKNITNLEYFYIYGLFGRYDVKIPFTKKANIFVGENGLGKTTILNCIYYVLEKKFTKLGKMNFEKIEVKFQKDQKIYGIHLSDVLEYTRKRNRNVNSSSNEDRMSFLRREIRSFIRQTETKPTMQDIERFMQTMNRRIGYPIPFIQEELLYYLDNEDWRKNLKSPKGNSTEVENLSKAISKNINQRIIYLPTYRRIENEFADLRIQSERYEYEKEDLLIRFGMSDVDNSIKTILNKIRTTSMAGFTEMTGILLEQYVNRFDEASSSTETRILNAETVKIVLDRVGDKIKDENKATIQNLIDNKQIDENKHKYLKNLLGKLIDNYDLQKQDDDRIKSFAETCNKYLNDKQFHYDPSTLSLEIYLDEFKTENKINLTQLSSGEKQIVSLFSKLYLENDEKSIVIIDEPELSLSIDWQQMLLPDIIRSANCELLLTVTHSPFIFENEFDHDAQEIRQFITKNKSGENYNAI